jgi:hypothetical protein
MKQIRANTSSMSAWPWRAFVLILGLSVVTGCASQPAGPIRAIHQSGQNTVWLERDPDSTANTHPVALTPTEVGTVLRGVRTWEQRNAIHRLFAGKADRTRAFRDEEIRILAPALSKALTDATPSERIHFRLSHATDRGEQETTTGWLSVRGELLHLSLGEVHDRHGPRPDISKYDRQMPDVPEASAPFDATFEPEEFLVTVRSAGGLFSTEQREELQIRYREALTALPAQPGLESHEQHTPPQP